MFSLDVYPFNQGLTDSVLHLLHLVTHYKFTPHMLNLTSSPETMPSLTFRENFITDHILKF